MIWNWYHISVCINKVYNYISLLDHLCSHSIWIWEVQCNFSSTNKYLKYIDFDTPYFLHHNINEHVSDWLVEGSYVLVIAFWLVHVSLEDIQWFWLTVAYRNYKTYSLYPVKQIISKVWVKKWFIDKSQYHPDLLVNLVLLKGFVVTFAKDTLGKLEASLFKG